MKWFRKILCKMGKHTWVHWNGLNRTLCWYCRKSQEKVQIVEIDYE